MSQRTNYWHATKWLTILLGCGLCMNACFSMQIVNDVMPISSSVDSFVLFARSDDLWQSDLNGQKIKRLTEGGLLNWHMEQDDDWMRAASYRPPQVSPNGQWAVLSQTGLDLILVNLESRKQKELSDFGAPIVAWSPDSRSFAYISMTGNKEQLYLYDVETDQRTTLLESEGDLINNIQSITWSPDGSRIAFVCCTNQTTNDTRKTGKIQVVDVSSKSVVKVEVVQASFAGHPPVCWTNNGTVTTKVETSVYCSTDQSLSYSRSPNGKQMAILGPQSPDDQNWTGLSQLTIKQIDTGEVLWQHELNKNFKVINWSPLGDVLFLDNIQSRSPIWYTPLHTQGQPAILIEEGFLVETFSRHYSYNNR